MKYAVLKSIVLWAAGIMVSCQATNRLINKNQKKMFTAAQIREKLLKVKTGADFPVLAMDLKNIGVSAYETSIENGRSVYQGQHGYTLSTEPDHEPIVIADRVNAAQLKLDIARHQQGGSDYLQISHQCAANGIEKWRVSLMAMTCTYVDKAGNDVWVEQIPGASGKKPSFTVDQIKTAHGKVRSGADFPAYIREIKALGVSHYETYVADGHIDYHGGDDYTVKVPAKYDPLFIADNPDSNYFKTELKAHQEGKTDFLTFIRMCATTGVRKWEIDMGNMTCTYYDKAGKELLVEHIPGN